MKKIFLILLLLLLPLAAAQDYASTVIIDGVEIKDVSFWGSLFATPEQSVLESTVQNKVVSGNQEVISTLTFQSKKYDAEAYSIYVYFYDTTLGKHIFKGTSSPIYGVTVNKPLIHGQLKEATFNLGPANLYLTGSNANHYIGVVGVLRLKVPKAQLSVEDLSKAECSGTSCWIYELYNQKGDNKIGTIAFNPVFFYSVPQTSQCLDKIGFVPGTAYCDGNKVYQEYVERDCSNHKNFVKTCGLNECVSGACVKTECPYTNKLISQSCQGGQLQQKIYDANCQIATVTIGACDEPSFEPQPPTPSDLEVPVEPFPCVPVSETCADGTTIELFTCPDLTATGNVCSSANVPSTEDTPEEKEPSEAQQANVFIKNNIGMLIIVIVLVLIAVALIIRRYKK